MDGFQTSLFRGKLSRRSSGVFGNCLDVETYLKRRMERRSGSGYKRCGSCVYAREKPRFLLGEGVVCRVLAVKTSYSFRVGSVGAAYCLLHLFPRLALFVLCSTTKP